MPNCRIGTLDALYRRISGGVMPVGKECSTDPDMAASCATAASTLACGWKKTLMMPRPCRDSDSMCSISLTEIVKARSDRTVMISAISSGETPP